MRGDRRLNFVKKWFGRAKKTEDPFDRFFYLWIALVVSAQHLVRGSCESDRERVIDYFWYNKENVLKVLSEHNDIMNRLAHRRGTRFGNPIIDAGEDLREKFRRLSDHYLRNHPLSSEEKVEIVAELLNRIRNNLFHGHKIYDDQEDISLLELVNPLLFDVLQICEPVG